MPIPESNLSHSTFWVKFEIYHTPAPQSAQISNNMYQPGGIFACGGADVYDIEHSVFNNRFVILFGILYFPNEYFGDNYLG